MIISETLKADEIIKGTMQDLSTGTKDSFNEIVELVSIGDLDGALKRIRKQYELQGDKLSLKMDPIKFAALVSIIQLEKLAQSR